MINPETATPAPVKKQWGNPELTLISQNKVHGGGHLTSTKETQFTPIPSKPGFFHFQGSTTFDQPIAQYNAFVHS